LLRCAGPSIAAGTEAMVWQLAVALLVLAGASGWIADRLLVRAEWVSRAPRSALLCWHSAAVTTLLSMVAVMVLVAHDFLEHALLWLLGSDKGELHFAYAGTSAVAPAWNLAAAGAAALVVAWAVIGWRYRRQDELERRKLRSAAATSVLVDGQVVHIMAGDDAVAFCLPGRRWLRGFADSARVVVSLAALRRLSTAQLAATVAHEQAHLAHHHHRAVAFARGLRATVGWTGALRSYVTQVRRLVELEADDSAASRHGHRLVAEALVEMCAPRPGPASVLPMGTGCVTERVWRLVDQTSADPRLEGRVRLLAVMLPALPVCLLLLPGFAVASGLHHL